MKNLNQNLHGYIKTMKTIKRPIPQEQPTLPKKLPPVYKKSQPLPSKNRRYAV